jgi:hypothetical protein
MQQMIFLQILLLAQYISGTIMPIIRSSRLLYSCLLPMVFGAEQSALNRRTVQPFTESDDTRCCDNVIYLPEDGHVNARNMSRIVM